MKRLRAIRTTVAAIFLLGITLLFLDITGVLHHYLGWMAQLQLIPAILSFNIGVVVTLLILTALFGRVYCSVICPLGVMQDLFSRIGVKHRGGYHYRPAHNVLRYTSLTLFILLLLLGVNSIALFFAPYSAYGRIASTLLQPLYVWGNNLMAALTANSQTYLFYSTPLFWRGAVAICTAMATLLLIGYCSLHYGRLWCNTICPVGALLSIVSRYALFRVTIDADRCQHCSQCAKKCKSSCIDHDRHLVDGSRCVACMNCLDACKFNAIHFQLSYFNTSKDSDQQNNPSDSVDHSRRRFLSTTALVAASATLSATAKEVDGGMAAIEHKQKPARCTPVRPFGSNSQRHFSSHCTACMLCVSQCPQHILYPSQRWESLMQPEMQFSDGYCPPECTRCSQVCPTGAIRPISPEQKTGISVGYAVVVADNCIAFTQSENCGSCARHCPAAAIIMVRDANGRSLPAVDENFCIGCGTCEFYCPARPFSAIYVEGRDSHTQI